MAYWRLFYHFVWTTKNREPWLTSDIEPSVYRFIHAEANKCTCHCLLSAALLIICMCWRR
jgi:putative transposase